MPRIDCADRRRAYRTRLRRHMRSALARGLGASRMQRARRRHPWLAVLAPSAPTPTTTTRSAYRTHPHHHRPQHLQPRLPLLHR
eukprot:668508-Prymnesium_polylepis.1